MAEQSFLIFWRDEDAVTAVPETKLVDPSHPTIGSICDVKMGRLTYSGEVVAAGTHDEMRQLEEDFETGKWLPDAYSPVNSVPPPLTHSKSPLSDCTNSKKGVKRLCRHIFVQTCACIDSID